MTRGFQCPDLNNFEVIFFIFFKVSKKKKSKIITPNEDGTSEETGHLIRKTDTIV